MQNIFNYFIIFISIEFFFTNYIKQTDMKKIQKNGFETFASLILEKEKLVEKLNNNQLSILKKTKDSKIKTPSEKGYLTKTITNIHKLSEQLY